MEGPILAYLISLMLIFSSLPNTTSSKSLVKRAIYRDAMGVVSNYFDCRKNYYHKREIYATIREGCVLYKYKKKVQATCSSLNKCKEYPYEFKNTKRIKFVIKGPYFSYPLLKSGGLYKGGTLTSHDRVIFDPECNFAGATTYGLRGIVEACKISYSPPGSKRFEYKFWRL